MKINSCVLVAAMIAFLLLPMVVPLDVSARGYECQRLRDKSGDDDLWEKTGGGTSWIEQDRDDGIVPVIAKDKTTPDVVATLNPKQRISVWLHFTFRLVLSR